jgi:hypothetical protein
MSKMFDIPNGKGFHITFKNGWTISVQFGGGNYCDNYDKRIYSEYCGPSSNAEIAAWKGETWFDFDGGQVAGYLSPDEVLKYMNIIASKED